MGGLAVSPVYFSKAVGVQLQVPDCVDESGVVTGKTNTLPPVLSHCRMGQHQDRGTGRPHWHRAVFAGPDVPTSGAES